MPRWWPVPPGLNIWPKKSRSRKHRQADEEIDMASTYMASNVCTQATTAGGFLNQLSPAALQDLRSMQFPSSYAANVVILSEKDPAKGIYIVLEGEVKMSLNSSEGRRL